MVPQERTKVNAQALMIDTSNAWYLTTSLLDGRLPEAEHIYTERVFAQFSQEQQAQYQPAHPHQHCEQELIQQKGQFSYPQLTQ